MEKSKWIATVASIWIQSSCGAPYAFGIYSATLKSSQGYDQSTLDTVSVFKDIGANIGVLSGILYHYVAGNRSGSRPSSRFRSGPWAVLLAGAVQCFVGYFLMWLSVSGVIERPHVLFMCLFMFMAAHAQTFFNTANVVVAVENFPDYGGTTVGIMKVTLSICLFVSRPRRGICSYHNTVRSIFCNSRRSRSFGIIWGKQIAKTLLFGFLGLSGAIIIQIYQTIIPGDPTSFILMLSLLPTLVTLVLMFFIHVNPSNTANDNHHLRRFSAMALTIAAYLTTIIIFQNIFTFPPWAHILTTTILVVFLLSPLQVALSAQKTKPPQPPSSATAPLIINSPAHDSAPVELNLLQAMATLDFWLLFLAMICGMGSGLATINNISQIGQSLKYSTYEVNALVSLWSIWNFLGRLGGGFVSDLFLHKHGWGRPLFIALTQATMVIGHLIIGSGGSLYIGSVIVGVCYGSQWSLMPTITSEIFGVKHMGTIFNMITAANPVGSYIFSVRVIGYIYDKEVRDGGGLCYGVHCFMVSFFVFAGVCVFGVFVSLVLFFRTRGFYALILQRRSKRVDV